MGKKSTGRRFQKGMACLLNVGRLSWHGSLFLLPFSSSHLECECVAKQRSSSHHATVKTNNTHKLFGQKARKERESWVVSSGWGATLH